MIRLTLTDDRRLQIHAPLGERDLMPDEIEMVRDALDPKALPWWLEWGTVLAVLGASAIWLRGGGA